MSTPTVDPSNIQGDVHPGFSKKAEDFCFFQIVDATAFRTRLPLLVPLISTGKDVAEGVEKIRKHKRESQGLLPIAFLNIAFSATGIKKMGINDNTQDPNFEGGMFNEAESLGDTVADWKPEFTKKLIDGVISVGGDSPATIAVESGKAQAILGDSIRTVTSTSGHVRPKDQDGHEHFGFKDGISNPPIDGIDDEDLSGEGKIDTGIIFQGRKGDTVTGRPSWTLDGTFLAFRYLAQLVPEFDMGVAAAAPLINDPSNNAVDLTGARLVGRWKSGAPVQLAPRFDDPALAADDKRNNAFTAYGDQDVCPFAAHTRKMNPRGDIGQQGLNLHRILRRGIPFGPEVTDKEKADGRTETERGLLFVSYQSALDGTPPTRGGFAFLQKSWANQVGFPPKPSTAGLDPIIGTVASGDVNLREMFGLSIGNPTEQFNFNRWIVPKGGEYFFVPSISTLRDVFGQAAKKSEL